MDDLLDNLNEDWCGADRPKYRLAAANEIERLKKTLFQGQEEICQRLGRVLKYPWYKDDPHTFPVAIADDGVCIGAHTAETLVAEAEIKIQSLERELAGATTLMNKYCSEMVRADAQAAAMREALESVLRAYGRVRWQDEIALVMNTVRSALSTDAFTPSP